MRTALHTVACFLYYCFYVYQLLLYNLSALIVVQVSLPVSQLSIVYNVPSLCCCVLPPPMPPPECSFVSVTVSSGQEGIRTSTPSKHIPWILFRHGASAVASLFQGNSHNWFLLPWFLSCPPHSHNWPTKQFTIGFPNWLSSYYTLQQSIGYISSGMTP